MPYSATGRLDLNPEHLASFPATISSRIALWAPISYDECVKAFEHSASLFKHMEIDQKNIMLYKALLQRDSGI